MGGLGGNGGTPPPLPPPQGLQRDSVVGAGAGGGGGPASEALLNSVKTLETRLAAQGLEVKALTSKVRASWRWRTGRPCLGWC